MLAYCVNVGCPKWVYIEPTPEKIGEQVGRLMRFEVTGCKFVMRLDNGHSPTYECLVSSSIPAHIPYTSKRGDRRHVKVRHSHQQPLADEILFQL